MEQMIHFQTHSCHLELGTGNENTKIYRTPIILIYESNLVKGKKIYRFNKKHAFFSYEPLDIIT